MRNNIVFSDQATAPLAEVLVMQAETLGGAPPLPQDHLFRGGKYCLKLFKCSSKSWLP